MRCDDDPLDLSKPRGKQDWQPEAHAIWYPRTTGLWQTVWTEVVPASRISGLRWRADVPNWSIRMDAAILNAPAGARLRVQLRMGERSLAADTYQEANGLLKMDRTPKFDLKLMSIATRGPNTPEETKLLDEALKH